MLRIYTFPPFYQSKLSFSNNLSSIYTIASTIKVHSQGTTG